MKPRRLGFYALLLSGSMALATSLSSDKPGQKAGWPHSNTSIDMLESPVTLDVNNDGKQEILTGGNFRGPPSTGIVNALDYLGKQVSGWPKNLSENGGYGMSPSVGDVAGGVAPEIVAPDWLGKVYVMSKEGKVLSPWPVQLKLSDTLDVPVSVYSPAALGDLDGDGKLDIVIGIDVPIAQEGGVYALKGDGTQLSGWPVKPAKVGADKGIRAAVALGDLDKDGKLDVVVGGKDGSIYAFKADGRLMWEKPTGAPIYASPVLGDIDKDGFLEVVDANSNGQLYALNHDGLDRWAAPVQIGQGTTQKEIPLALADLDGDGNLEIVANGINEKRVYAIRANGTQLWATDLPLPQPVNLTTAPTVVDADGDSTLEVYTGWPNHLYSLDSNGQPNWAEELLTEAACYRTNPPTFADLEGDGKTDMILAGGKVDAFEFGGSYRKEGMAWPMFRHDAKRTGNYDAVPDTVKEEPPTIPSNYRLSQNYPNPFNQKYPTTVEFDLSKGGNVKLRVYNVLGQEVRNLQNGYLDVGSYKRVWDGRTANGNNAPSGVYFLNLKVDDNKVGTTKAALIR